MTTTTSKGRVQGMTCMTNLLAFCNFSPGLDSANLAGLVVDDLLHVLVQHVGAAVDGT